jgi:Tol biopolymer transport system component
LTTAAPPRPPRASDPVDRDELEALIEEARRRSRRRRRIHGALVLATVAAVAGAAILVRAVQTDGSASAAVPRSSVSSATAVSKIAFVRHTARTWVGPSDLHVMNADGSGQKRLARVAEFFQPAWSPDGRRIAFTGEIGSGIYVMNAGGRRLRRLTRQGLFPSWSPDGRTIAFVKKPPGQFSLEIYVVNTDGSGQRRLTRNTADDYVPAFSPDGRRIVFWSLRDGNPEIYVMNADGSHQTNLTQSSANDRLPTPVEFLAHHSTWSPDGKQIAYVSSQAGVDDVWVMNADGTGKHNVTHSRSGVLGDPAWSPDGRKIAFVAGPWKNLNIWVVNADRGAARRLTFAPGRNYSPAWSPDGRKIAFESQRDGNYEIYLMNADGTAQTNLTKSPAQEGRITWSPPATR